MSADPADPSIGRTLFELTAAKTVANTALRWVPLFLPTLEAAFGASTTQLTTVLGVGELAGFSTISTGPRLDRGRERAVMVSALGLVAASSVIALGGSTVSFAVAFFVLVLGVANFTVAGQSWISHRVPYGQRARSLGLFETSWALALLVGAPAIALLITVFGWRGPFVALAIGASAAAVVVARVLPPWADHPGEVVLVPVDRLVDGGVVASIATSGRPAITASAWLVMVGSAATAMAGLSVFVVTGSWLDQNFGISTGGIGVVAIAFGAIELTASLASAGIADAVGKLRSTITGLCALALGLCVMVTAGDALWAGIVGLLVFLLGFEFAFVTSLSLVSEAMPGARGSTLAMSNAVATVARAGGAVLSGWLFGRYGIGGTAALAASSAVAAGVTLVLSRRSAARATPVPT